MLENRFIFFDCMDAVFGCRANVNPPCVFQSQVVQDMVVGNNDGVEGNAYAADVEAAHTKDIEQLGTVQENSIAGEVGGEPNMVVEKKDEECESETVENLENLKKMAVDDDCGQQCTNGKLIEIMLFVCTYRN